MKKQIMLMAIAMFSGISCLMAQGGNFQRRSPEERTKAVMEKIAEFKLDKEKSDKTDSVFLNFYRAQDKMMAELRAGGGAPDRDAMMAARKKLSDERDAQLKLIFTDDQMKKWKDEIEPSMRPQRGNSQGNGQ